MPSSYDPRRSRPRPAAAPDPESAPVDALLGPEPRSATPDAHHRANGSGRPTAVGPQPAPRGGAPSMLWQLAPLAAILTVVLLAVWWLTRRRGR